MKTFIKNTLAMWVRRFNGWARIYWPDGPPPSPMTPSPVREEKPGSKTPLTPIKEDDETPIDLACDEDLEEVCKKLDPLFDLEWEKEDK